MASATSAARATPTAVIEIISDVVCPWCYIGKHRLARGLAAVDGDHVFDIRWRPYELNPGLPVEGMDRRDYCEAKFGSLDYANRLYANVVANAEQDGLPMAIERVARTPNTRRAHRLIESARDGDHQDALVDGLFSAYFVEGRDVGDDDTLIDIAQTAGIDREQARRALDDPALDAAVSAAESEAREHGVTGVPSYLYNGLLLLNGAQSEDTVRLTIERAIRKGL